MRRGAAAAGAALCGAVLIAASPAGSLPHGREYRDGPPPGFSGGFGENSCQGCHADFDLNAAGGSVTLRGVPERFSAGQVYPLEVTLVRSGMRVGGFEATARFEEGGAQAGSLGVPSDSQGRLAVVTDRDVQYAYQRQAGSRLVAPDTARWTVLWTAPAGGGAVVFNVAANAANEDDSTLGDYIYTTSAKANPR